MRLDRTGTLVFSKALRHFGLVSRESGIPILMYHSISDDVEERVHPYYRLATSPRRFRAQMEWLQNNGFQVITLFEAICRLESGTAGRSRCVVLTFDDGFREFRTAAWPVLQALQFPATVFLPTAFIDDVGRLFKGRQCLTWSDVRELHKSGVAFGSHTVTHPILYDLDWSAIRVELTESKSVLEHRIGAAVYAFAYPYAFPQEDADFVRCLHEELAEAGYHVGVTTMVGRATTRHNRLTFRRMPVNESDDDSLFAAKLFGLYDWIAHVQTLRRLTRRNRRRHPKERVTTIA